MHFRKPDKYTLSIFFASLVLSLVTFQSSAKTAILEEIVVTAQKRSENIQDVPIAISAFTSNELESMGLGSTLDLGDITPGLQMTKQVGSATPFLRGVGTRASNNGVESPVASYVDGMYIGSLLGSILEFNNIERIEVLKGPQGTLFGRNATGGLVHVITRDPSQEPAGKISVNVGSEELYGSKAYFAGPITDTLAADLAISVQRMDGGFGENLTTGNDTLYDEYSNYRSKWVWTPSDATTIKFIASYGEMETDAGISRGCLESRGCFGSFPPSDYYDTYSNLNNGVDGDYKTGNLNINHVFDNYEVTSITTYQDASYDHVYDQDFGPIAAIDALYTNSNKTFSQELQLKSNYDGAFNWIGGLFYWDDETGTEISISQLAFDVDNTQDTKSYAVFGEGTYDFSEQTGITLGLRYTEDERELNGTSLAGPFISNYDVDETFEEMTWRAVINHYLPNDTLIYASYNRGFRSGLFNTAIFAPSAPVEPEILDAYEIGFKGDYLDSRLRLNGAVFYYDYKDNIVQVPIPGGADLRNAASSEIWGGELEGQFVASENLRMRFGLSYLDGEYKEHNTCAANLFDPNAFGPGIPGANVGPTNCTGNDTAQTPEWTANVGGIYDIPTEAGVWSTSLSVAYNDGFYWEEANQVKESSYTLINAEVSWTSPSERYRVRIYGRNLLDEEYSIFSTVEAFGATYSPAWPINWGAAFEVSLF